MLQVDYNIGEEREGVEPAVGEAYNSEEPADEGVHRQAPGSRLIPISFLSSFWKWEIAQTSTQEHVGGGGGHHPHGAHHALRGLP